MNPARPARGPCAKFGLMLQRTTSTLIRLGLALLVACPAAPACAQPAPAADPIVQAREALKKKDRAALADARMGVNAARHPLAMWVEYWELSNRLTEAQQPELDAFAARWPGSYVEDRLRNDWLLELGHRRDWANFRAEMPRFRMNDDREVSCYALLVQHLDGQDVRNAARAAWLAQREPDEGCALLARTLTDARVLAPDDAWQAARLAMEFNRPKLARAAGLLVGAAAGKAVADLYDNPAQFLRRKHTGVGNENELVLLALMRLAANDPEYTAGQLEATWAPRLPATLFATAWAHAGKQAALKQLPQAADYARRAWQIWDKASRSAGPPPWSDDLLAWQVRAALRQPDGDPQRWALVARAIDALGGSEQREATWVYWRARARLALEPAGAEGDAARDSARAALEGIAGQQSFYGKLATEELGRRLALPAAPAPLAPAERDAARQRAGLGRALQLIELGLRSEGVREWNFTLRGLPDRELLAAAQWACEREVWDRCISASDRTRTEIDMAQRFPMPFRDQMLAQARKVGLDPAVMYGLIRQESRFVTDARSHVGASGLMQIMPATARWTAKKVGLDYRADMLADRDTNLYLGAAYLKRVLDDFGGSLPLAAAAYNAGPGRPRRWRETAAPIEPAAWAETIPFNETRDYVKKVLSNSIDYAALLARPDAAVPTLKSRLGPAIGAREPGAANLDRELPETNPTP
jgi:soluble lytic murein transglycosylase